MSSMFKFIGGLCLIAAVSVFLGACNPRAFDAQLSEWAANREAFLANRDLRENEEQRGRSYVTRSGQREISTSERRLSRAYISESELRDRQRLDTREGQPAIIQTLPSGEQRIFPVEVGEARVARTPLRTTPTRSRPSPRVSTAQGRREVCTETAVVEGSVVYRCNNGKRCEAIGARGVERGLLDVAVSAASVFSDRPRYSTFVDLPGHSRRYEVFCRNL